MSWFESPIDSNCRSRSLHKDAGEVLAMTVEDNKPQDGYENRQPDTGSIQEQVI
jgi:hypothetical protein